MNINSDINFQANKIFYYNKYPNEHEVVTGELINISEVSSPITPVKRPNSSICLTTPTSCVLSSSTSSYFSMNTTELNYKPRQKASSLTLEANSFQILVPEHESMVSNSLQSSERTSPMASSMAISPILANGDIFRPQSPFKPPRPPAPSIHICTNPLTEVSHNESPRPSLGYLTPHRRSDDRSKSPSPCLLDPQNSPYPPYRTDRLFSLGPTFHIQLKHPSNLDICNWQHRTKLEKQLILTMLCLGLFMPLLVLFSYTLAANLKDENREAKICTTAECVKTASSLINAMDLVADPCDDFFQFACGSWNKKHIIPEDRSSISTFEVLADELQIILKDVLEESANGHDNSATIKAKTLYKSCMKLDKITDMGDALVRKAMEDVGGWPVTESNWKPPQPPDVEILLGKLRGDYNQGVIIEQWVGPDDRNSSANIIQIDQMLFGLPSREYYYKDSSKKDREAYLKLMIEVAILMGAQRDSAVEQMDQVLQFETKLALASTPEADRHDTGAIYKKISIDNLTKIVGDFNWLLYLNTFLPMELAPDEPVVVYAISYLQAINRIIKETPREVIQNYAVWRLVKYLLPYLDGEYGQRRAEFRKVLLGVSAERVRWNQCVDLVNKRLGMAVGALFVRNYFDPISKETALEMIHNIRRAFNELLLENVWMDEETKKVAQEKANAMNERIGYPEILTNSVELSKEYQNLQVFEDQFLQSILNLLKFESSKNLLKLRKPVNKDRWTTEPAVVNAFYNPNKNDIVFPAGILQPLFYSQYFPKSLNYGGIGVVIGHEITHGFDDKGRQFDKEGNLKQWWNNATIERFRERAQCIIDQYSSYVLEDIGLNVNGKMTQGENIADNGGLKQAYRAFKKWETDNGSELLLPGLNLTHDQLFFLNYAQIWCGSMRPEDALSKIRTSVHSPGPIRVLGPLSNSFDFSRAYSCPVGSRMNPIKKCSVW